MHTAFRSLLVALVPFKRIDGHKRTRKKNCVVLVVVYRPGYLLTAGFIIVHLLTVLPLSECESRKDLNPQKGKAYTSQWIVTKPDRLLPASAYICSPYHLKFRI